MAQLEFTIRKPAAGATVGRRIAASGSAGARGTGYPFIDVDAVRVDFGDGGGELPADIGAGRWSCTGVASRTVAGGSPLTITAILAGTRVDNVGTPTEPRDGPPQRFESRRTVTVILAEDVPEGVTIDSFQSPVTPAALPYRISLSGTANDPDNEIRSVQLRVDSGPFVDVDVDVRFGIWFWRKRLDLPAGQHHFTVRAVDGAGNPREASAVLSVREPFEPGEIDQAFAPARYLLELLGFAKRYVKIDGAIKKLTPEMLAERFHQPFDRLTQSRLFEPATRALPQARIAVEVLRDRLKSPAPAELDQRFRGTAYQALLRELGTSYEELRLARTADTPVRQAVAARLGLELVAARPDRLDELTVSPETISDTQLETLFGYQSTAPGDPLRTPPDAASVLLWQRDTL